jgi:hypothetical protein
VPDLELANLVPVLVVIVLLLVLSIASRSPRR